MPLPIILGALVLFSVILAFSFNHITLGSAALRRVAVTTWIVSGLAYALLLAWGIHDSDTRSSLLAAAGLAASAMTTLGAAKWKIGKRFPTAGEVLVGQVSGKGEQSGRLFVYILCTTLAVAALSFILEPDTDVRHLFERAAFAGVILGLLLYASGERSTDPKA